MALAMPASAFAAGESGDAGELPATAQDLSTEPVDQVSGSFATGADADLYRVCLEGGGTFSASTVGGSDVDTQLFLLDAQGHGVYANDDAEATRQSTLPSLDPLTPSAPGVYLLGVSPYNRDPHGATSAIFPNSGGVLAPISDEPLASWIGSARRGGTYGIALTGTTTCAPADETPPTIDLRVPADGASVARGAEVAVDFDCADEGGSGLASCEGSVADGAALDTSSLGDRAVTVTARDAAGNETVVTHTAHVVDATGPVVSLLTPLDGAVYLLGQDVTADYSCADEEGGSGLASCTGDVPDGRRRGHGIGGGEGLQRAGARTGREVPPRSRTATGWSTTSASAAGAGIGTATSPRKARAGRLVVVRFSIDGFHGRDVVADGLPAGGRDRVRRRERARVGRSRPHPRRAALVRAAGASTSSCGRPSAAGPAPAASSSSGSTTAPCTGPSTASSDSRQPLGFRAYEAPGAPGNRVRPDGGPRAALVAVRGGRAAAGRWRRRRPPPPLRPPPRPPRRLRRPPRQRPRPPRRPPARPPRLRRPPPSPPRPPRNRPGPEARRRGRPGQGRAQGPGRRLGQRDHQGLRLRPRHGDRERGRHGELDEPGTHARTPPPPPGAASTPASSRRARPAARPSTPPGRSPTSARPTRT